MKSLILLSATLTLLCCTGNAFAWPEYVTCRTESNGLQFSKSERDLGLARRLITGDCTHDGRTNNDECSANLWCDDQNPNPPPMVACETESNALTFHHASRDVKLSRELAIATCSHDSRTNNDECRSNVVCDDGSPAAPVISCKTDSNGLNFIHQGRDPHLARDLSISACTKDGKTNNDQCRANVWCSNQGPYPVRYFCSTRSNDLTFQHDGLSQALEQSLTVSACTADGRTNNDECRVNIFCESKTVGALY